MGWGAADRACCDASSCSLKAAGTVCRSAVEACDLAETCSGASPLCPSDRGRPIGSACTTSFNYTCEDKSPTSFDYYRQRLDGKLQSCAQLAPGSCLCEDKSPTTYKLDGQLQSCAQLAHHCVCKDRSLTTLGGMDGKPLSCTEAAYLCVCKDKTKTGWRDGKGNDLSCAQLSGYCNHASHGAGVRAACPVTCGSCTENEQRLDARFGARILQDCPVTCGNCTENEPRLSAMDGALVKQMCPVTCGSCTANGTMWDPTERGAKIRKACPATCRICTRGQVVSENVTSTCYARRCVKGPVWCPRETHGPAALLIHLCPLSESVRR